MRNLGFPTAAVLLIAAATGSGCATATSKYYTLSSTVASSTLPATKDTVLVGPVTVPDAVDRPQFVVQVAPNRVEINELNCWAAPLGDGIASAVVGDLSVLLGTKDVFVAPVASVKPTHRVTIDVRRFDSMPGQKVVVDALWNVVPTASGAAERSGRTTAEEAVVGKDYDALTAAHSRALAKVSADIAAAVRAAEPAPVEKKKR